MSSSLLAAVSLAAGLGVAFGQAAPHEGVGRPAPRELIRSWDLSVAPDGTGLPAGHGTAREGRQVYALRCASCHGDHGEGRGDYPPLAGGRGTLAMAEPVQTVGSFWPYATTVWDYIRRAMPYDQPGALGPDQVYALTAFLLQLNGIVGQDEVLNEKTLPRVKMPNRDGFIADPRPDVGSTSRSSRASRPDCRSARRPCRDSCSGG